MSLQAQTLPVVPPLAGTGRSVGWLALVPRRMPALAAMAAWVLGGTIASRTTRGAGGAAGEGALSRFEALVLPHIDAAYTLAVYLCRDRDAAEDVVQEAFLRAFRGFDGFRGDNARAWLLAIVRNCHLSWREELRRRSSVIDESPVRGRPDGDDAADVDDAPDGEDDPEAMLVRQGEAECVRAVLAELPEAAREILVLRDVEELAYREIAQVLEVPLGTVMSRLARARKAFALRWRASQQDGGEP